jgi:NADH-quinone oxidoreductase subunit M
MNLLHLPWLEISLALPVLGAVIVSQLREPVRAFRWGLGFTAAAFACTVMAWIGFYFAEQLGIDNHVLDRYSLQFYLLGNRPLYLDQLGAPLVPAVALLHFLTALATARTKMRRYSLSWSLAGETIRLATFTGNDPWLLIGLLTASVVTPYFELVNRRSPTRVYVLHMGLFVGLMVLGQLGVDSAADSTQTPTWAVAALLAAVLVRCGTVPAHCWVTDWFEHASFGNALLFVVPLSGVYAAIHLVLPIAPPGVLAGLGLASLITAVYAAAMSVVQREARRFFAYLFLSHASLVLIGLELVGLDHPELPLTGSLCLWFSAILSLGGFGLTLRAVEARFGRLSLSHFHGLYEHSPALAVCFLLTGLASVGFPGTLGFVSSELLVDGAIHASRYVGIAVVAAAALNGIAVVRAYFLLFTGARHGSTVSLAIGVRERIAVLTLAALILGGGLFPQPGVRSRYLAAQEVLSERKVRDAHPQMMPHDDNVAAARGEPRQPLHEQGPARARVDGAP